MSVSDLTGVGDIAVRYFKNDQVCQVSYAIELRDGRLLRLDVPCSQDHSEAQAKEYARKHAEDYVSKLLYTEASTGRYVCCGRFKPQHRNSCKAIRR